MTPEIQELKRLAEAAMPSLSEMMVVEFAEFSSVRDQDGASIAQVRGGVPYFDKEVAAYIAAASPSTILALIEVAEAAKGMLAHACIADADPCDVDEEDRALERRLRTALEGVKK